MKTSEARTRNSRFATALLLFLCRTIPASSFTSGAILRNGHPFLVQQCSRVALSSTTKKNSNSNGPPAASPRRRRPPLNRKLLRRNNPTDETSLQTQDQSVSIQNSTKIGVDPTLVPTLGFNDIGLEAPFKRTVVQQQWKQMTPIQAKSWFPVSQGSSVLGRARTGTGKTCAFLLPALQRLKQMPPTAYRPGRQIGMLIVTPTRELTQQIATEADRLLQYVQPDKHWTVQAMYGGTRTKRDIAVWSSGRKGSFLPAVLVTTPGRLLHHIQQTRIRGRRFGQALLSEIPVVVFDEADHLVDGFWKETKRIVSDLPRKRQTLLYSATIPKRLESLLEEILAADNYVRADCVSDSDITTQTSTRVEQYSWQLERMEDYVTTLVSLLLRTGEDSKMVVFFPTAKLVRFFAEFFTKALKLPGEILEIHSRMSQASRSRASTAFRQAKVGILLSSDVSARGMDYPDVTHVIQYGAPFSMNLYLHRLGRTGRAGAGGTGIQVLLPFESSFRSKLKKLGAEKCVLQRGQENKQAVQAMVEQGRQLIQSGHVTLTPKAEAAYLSIVAYYLEYAGRNVSADQIEQAAASFCESVGLVNVPSLPEDVASKLQKRRGR